MTIFFCIFSIIGCILHTIGCCIINENADKGGQFISIGFGLFAAVVITSITLQ